MLVPVPLTPRSSLQCIYSCLLPDVPGSLLEARVAFLVCASAAKSQAHNGWPRPPLEQQDGEYDAEAEAQGRFDQQVGETPVPLRLIVSRLALDHCRPASGLQAYPHPSCCQGLGG